MIQAVILATMYVAGYMAAATRSRHVSFVLLFLALATVAFVVNETVGRIGEVRRIDGSRFYTGPTTLSIGLVITCATPMMVGLLGGIGSRFSLKEWRTTDRTEFIVVHAAWLLMTPIAALLLLFFIADIMSTPDTNAY